MAESITLVGLMLQALKRVPLQDIFAQDPYESTRTKLGGKCQCRLEKIILGP
jgi:hypothetical protein